MSVLKGRVSFGTRPRDEEIEGLIMWMLFGGAGVLTILLVFCCILKHCKESERDKYVNHDNNFYWSETSINTEQCKEGKNIQVSASNNAIVTRALHEVIPSAK